MTCGEQPITAIASGGGSVNRTIELRCEEGSLFGSALECKKLANTIKKNYGHLGEQFIELLKDEDIRAEMLRYEHDVVKTLSQINLSTAKQTDSAALILTADYLATKYIFKDKKAVQVDEILPFLSGVDEISEHERAFDWLMSWVGKNVQQFITDDRDQDDIHGGVYGRFIEAAGQKKGVAINRAVFNEACLKEDINPTALAQWLKDHNVTETAGNRIDKSIRVGGVVAHCIVIKELPDDIDFEEATESEAVPW